MELFPDANRGAWAVEGDGPSLTSSGESGQVFWKSGSKLRGRPRALDADRPVLEDWVSIMVVQTWASGGWHPTPLTLRLSRSEGSW